MSIKSCAQTTFCPTDKREGKSKFNKPALLNVKEEKQSMIVFRTWTVQSNEQAEPSVEATACDYATTAEYNKPLLSGGYIL